MGPDGGIDCLQPDPMNRPDGSRSHNRRPLVGDLLASEDPALVPVGLFRAIACHFARPASGRPNTERKDVTP